MPFFSWAKMAEMDGTSVSTQKRLEANDPRYPTKYNLSPGRVGFCSKDTGKSSALAITAKSAIVSIEGEECSMSRRTKSRPACLNMVSDAGLRSMLTQVPI